MVKLFIDCTATYFSNLNTGIQRTTRKIIENKKYFDPSIFDEIVSVIQFNGNYYIVAGEKVVPLLTTFVYKTGAKIKNFYDSVIPGTNNTLESVNDERGGSDGKILVLLRFIHGVLFKLTRFVDSIFLKSKRVEFKANDILFIPDSFWDPLFDLDALLSARDEECKIILFVHDIFPITHPQLVSLRNVEMFSERFNLIVAMIDGYICNSKFTLVEVKKYFKNNYCSYSKLSGNFVHLGADVLDGKMTIARNRSLEIPLNYYMMVGTLEPKKNHDYVLSVFKKLWDNGYSYPLIIVGRIGWKCDKTLLKIESSDYLNKYLFMFNDTSDEQLVSFYQNCRAVIMASFIEGYGLPVVEAMQFEKNIFASDIPIFREIGQDYPFYFDLSDELSLVNLIKEYECCDDLQKKRDTPPLMSWEECVKQLSNQLSHFVQ